MRQRVFLLFLFIIGITSCQVEKRLYRSGFYVDRRETPTTPHDRSRSSSEQSEEPLTISNVSSVDTSASPPPALQPTSTDSTPPDFFQKENILRNTINTQVQHQVTARKKALRFVFRQSNMKEPINDDVLSPLIISAVVLFFFGPFTLLFLLNPSAIFNTNSFGDALFIAASPVFLMLFILFAPFLIRTTIRAMRKEEPGSRTRRWGVVAILGCVLAGAASLLTFAYMLMHPELMIIAFVAAILCLIGLLISMI